MQDCSANEKKLSDDTVRNIEDLIDNKLAFVLAVDFDGNLIPLISKSLDFEIRDVSELSINNPIKTTGITGIENATFVSFLGSCIRSVTVGGKTYYVSVNC